MYPHVVVLAEPLPTPLSGLTENGDVLCGPPAGIVGATIPAPSAALQEEGNIFPQAPAHPRGLERTYSLTEHIWSGQYRASRVTKNF